MEEKKLTDEEIVKALECCVEGGRCGECPFFINRIDCINSQRSEKYYLDLMHRLQDELIGYETGGFDLIPNALNKKILDFMHRLQNELKKELAEHEEFTKKAKAEIERLTEENKQYFAENERLNKSCGIYQIKIEEQIKETYDYVHKSDKLKKRNAELQKQVDELRKQLLMAKLQGLNEGYNNGVQAERNAQIFKPMITKLPKEIAEPIRQQTVKDTAKEILQELWDETEPLNESHKWVRLRIKNIASRKGVEVE